MEYIIFVHGCNKTLPYIIGSYNSLEDVLQFINDTINDNILNYEITNNYFQTENNDWYEYFDNMSIMG